MKKEFNSTNAFGEFEVKIQVEQENWVFNLRSGVI